MQISKELIDRVLAIYKPEQRVLLEAQLDYPVTKGKFFIGHTSYTIQPFKHATDIDIQLCLNQLFYAGLAQLVLINHEQFRGINFGDIQKEGLLLTRTLKYFKKLIKRDEIFWGEATLEDIRKCKNYFFMKTSFSFEDRSCFGEEHVIIRGL